MTPPEAYWRTKTMSGRPMMDIILRDDHGEILKMRYFGLSALRILSGLWVDGDFYSEIIKDLHAWHRKERQYDQEEAADQA